MPWPIASLASWGINALSSGRLGSGEDIGEFCPGIAAAHIDTADSLDARPWRVHAEQGRGVTALHATPELPLGSDEEVLVEGIGIDFDFGPPPAAGNYR
jgi:hypothetical protein